MKASEGIMGRVFMIKLEHGDVLPKCIEQFCYEKQIKTGQIVLIGGIGGGDIVVGPRRSQERPPEPMLLPLDGAHEVAGIGIIAPDIDGRPQLHIHAALGRSGKTITGCLRSGVSTWVVAEVIIYEILGVNMARFPDKETGFTLLDMI